MIKARKIMLLMPLLIMAAACSPRIIERAVTRTEYKDRIVRDSVFFRDSIYIIEYVKDNTAHQDKYVERWRFRDREIHDTLRMELHDTVTVNMEVPAKLTKIQQAKLDTFNWILAALVLTLIIALRKPLLKLAKTWIPTL